MDLTNQQSSPRRVILRISIPVGDYQKFRELYPEHGEVSLKVRDLMIKHVKEKKSKQNRN